MRKILSYTLLITFILSVLQSGIKVHYCGNELTGIDIFNGLIHSEDCDCADEGEETCCSDLLIQAPDANNFLHQKATTTIRVNQLTVVLFTLVQTETYINKGLPVGLNLLQQNRHAPPQLPVLANLGVFRI